MMQAGRDYGTRMMRAKTQICRDFLTRIVSITRADGTIIKLTNQDETPFRSINQDKPKLHLK